MHFNRRQLENLIREVCAAILKLLYLIYRQQPIAFIAKDTPDIIVGMAFIVLRSGHLQRYLQRRMVLHPLLLLLIPIMEDEALADSVRSYVSHGQEARKKR